MVDYVLANLQPYLWTTKKETLQNFEEFYFRQQPKVDFAAPRARARSRRLATHPTPQPRSQLSEALIRDLLTGTGGKGRGLLEAIGGTSWKSKAMRVSSGQALALLLKLLDPKQNEHAGDFAAVLKVVDVKHLRCMQLNKHVTAPRGNREGAERLARFLRDVRPDVSLVPESEESKAAAAAAAAAAAPAPAAAPPAEQAGAAASSGSRRSSLVAQHEELVRKGSQSQVAGRHRRLSTRSALKELISKEVIKQEGKAAPKPKRSSGKIKAKLKRLFTSSRSGSSVEAGKADAAARKGELRRRRRLCVCACAAEVGLTGASAQRGCAFACRSSASTPPRVPSSRPTRTPCRRWCATAASRFCCAHNATLACSGCRATCAW
jgi:hypothetical protein